MTTNRAFAYARYDVDLRPSGLDALGLEAREQRLTMDNVQAINVFYDIGKAAAQQVDVSKHFNGFIEWQAARYLAHSPIRVCFVDVGAEKSTA